MAENKKSFVLYKDWIQEVEKLSSEQSGVLFLNILKFVNNEAVNIEDDSLVGIYNAIIEQIVYEWSKFNPKTKKYHWNYQGGITPENKIIRNSTEIKNWRNAVFNRDKYTCQSCYDSGGILNAHHIKPFSKYPNLRTELSNGITLCKKCHIEVHSKN